MKEGKSYEISQHQILEAYKRVKANKGADGIDGINFESYEKNLITCINYGIGCRQELIFLKQ